MAIIVAQMLGIIITAGLAGRAGQTEQLFMQRPQQGPTQQLSPAITFPHGTTFGGALGRQASELAQIIVAANNNNMQDYQKFQGMESTNLQTSQQALTTIEQLSNAQGTGEITPFFATGSHETKGNPGR